MGHDDDFASGSLERIFSTSSRSQARLAKCNLRASKRLEAAAPQATAYMIIEAVERFFHRGCHFLASVPRNQSTESRRGHARSRIPPDCFQGKSRALEWPPPSCAGVEKTVQWRAVITFVISGDIKRPAAPMIPPLRWHRQLRACQHRCRPPKSRGRRLPLRRAAVRRGDAKGY